MNTVKIGNDFELKSYEVIAKAIENGELGISQSSAKVFQKKGYYSSAREKDIIFDLSIEIWPVNAARYTLLFLIECKSSSVKNVPVDDVEEFYAKILQVAGVNVKGVMISDNSFQEGGLTFAKNKGLMLIEVDNTGEHDIILHKTEREKENIPETDTELLFEKFIKKTLGLQEIKGLQKLSAKHIEEFASIILKEYSSKPSPIILNEFMPFISQKYNLVFNIECNLETINGKKIFGYYSIKENTIYIDQTIISTNQFSFVLGHELGHYFLHSNLTLNQEQYNDFADSEYNFFTDKHSLKNNKNWIEWQANRFAVSLFLQKELFLNYLYAYRKSIGISRFHHIYLDDQKVNQFDYRMTVDYLANTFNISKTAVKYRIDELEIITHAESKNDFRSNLRKYLFE